MGAFYLVPWRILCILYYRHYTMIDYSTSSILSKCANLDDSGFLPIYEAYFGLIQEDSTRIVYLSTNVDRKFIALLCKIFSNPDFNLVVCTDSDYKSSDSRVTIHTMDYAAPTSSLLGKINAYGPIDMFINEATMEYPDQISTMKMGFRYIVPGGYYIIKNVDGDINLKKALSYSKMLRKSAMDIEWIRNYNDESFSIIKKTK